LGDKLSEKWMVYFATKFLLQKKAFGMLAAVVMTFLTIAVITLLAIKHQPKRKLEVGSICVVVTIAMYIAPLSVMVRFRDL
jgi:hypothetical protein